MTAVDIWCIVLSVGLIGLAGLLISAETAINRVSRGRIDDIRRESGKRAEKLLVVLADRARYVNVLLFLSTSATVTATALITFASYDVFTVHGTWPVGGALAFAVVIMVVIAYVALGVAPRETLCLV